MARFFGRYEHSLDDKGRVILPSKFRGPFERGGYLTQYQDGCLSLWTPDEFESQMEVDAGAGGVEPRATGTWRGCGPRPPTRWRSTDRAGWPFPPISGSSPGLDGDVLVHGAIDRVELWNPTRWEEKVQPEEERLTAGDDD